MAEAIRGFLCAAGLDPAAHPELASTPELVARAWAEEFLGGYGDDPRRILSERMSAPRSSAPQMVALIGLSFQSTCPHHLLPYGGVAHVAYLPGRFVVGFGQIVKLLDCLGHRLILQEDLARQIADALVELVGARGAGVVLEAQQSCLALRGGRRPGSCAVAEAWAGAFERDSELRERFLAAMRRG
ncbi:MAG: GTP cyclohydrolase I FolE [Deltaproteobacteria bacterium]|nr:GTP cyclohydrolase I FolE [Deltaproteobacteria bacterium]